MNRLKLLLALLLAIAALAITACSTTKVVTAGTSADTIAVTGSGSAKSAPDRVRVGFGVEVRDADPRKAMSRVSQASNKLTAALRKAGIADKDLQTGSVRLEAQYAYERRGPRRTGYLAAIDISAVTRELAKTGDVIVAGTSAGATRVNGITFDLDDTNPARYEASAQAVKDARKKAEAMAKAAGRGLGQVVSIGQPQPTGGVAYRYMPNYTSSPEFAARSAYIPELSPGQLSAGDSVQVVFALK